MTRRLVSLVLAATLAAGSTGAAAGPHAESSESPRADEYRVKAAFLFNFAKFVEWPPQAFAGQTASLTLCVLGMDPFGNLLDDTLKGRAVAGRPIAIRRIAELEQGCHVLFISSSERKRLALLTHQLRGASVLTVSEEAGFTKVGGMIELFNAGESVQFNIAPAAVERSGLHASARLIALAANQRRQTGGRP
jgi:hypothetical protein